VETEVFQQQGLAGLQVAHQLGGDVADALRREGDVLLVADDVIEQLAQTVNDRAEAHGRNDLALGAAKVRTENDARFAAQRVLDGGNGLADARVVGDTRSSVRPVRREGNIEVDADENALVGKVKIADRQLRHAVSFMQEKSVVFGM
jgi:hypothetical protein